MSAILLRCVSSWFIFAFMKDPRQFLKDTLSERIASNASYSLRAFARDLSISPQQLSSVLNGQRGISARAAEKLATKLGLSSQQKEIFCQSACAQFSRGKVAKAIAQAKLDHLTSNTFQSAALELDVLKTISNWYHFALLSLIKMPVPKTHKQGTVSWYSKKLKISENEVLAAWTRL